MKKIFFGLAALMLSMTVLAERVSQEDAALVANNFMNVGNTVSGVQKAPAKKMVLKKAATASENQYYVYENANGEGWVMVAANDIAHPILAYSETGHFRTDNQPANLKVWLRGYDSQILKAENAGLVANDEVKNEWSALRSGVRKVQAAVVVAPLIKTGWDQDSPYWNQCPSKSGSKCYTGCVATAMAQVMNYHQWPKQGTGSHSIKVNSTTYTVNFGETTYDWDNMLDTYGSSATTAQKNAVATLMYHCGVAVDMQYGTADEGGSGAYTIDFNGYWTSQGKMCAETALKQFFGYNAETVKGYYRDGDSDEGMKSWTKSEWIAMLKEELDAARPIMYAGAGCDDPTDEETCYGHSFICDGYDSSNKFHFNWGWSNSCDGYYDVDALEPAEPGSGGGNGEYNLEQDVIVGIMPPALGPDVNITWMADGEVFANTVASHGVIVLPTSNPTPCDGKVFMGWTAADGYEGDVAPSYVHAGTVLDEDATFYAVYATQEGSGTPVSTTTYTFNSKSWGDSQNAWTSDKDVNQYQSGKGVQVTSGLSGAGATTKKELGNVSKVVVNYCTNASSGAGSITIKVGTASKVLDVTKAGGTELRDLEFTFDNASGKVSIEVTCTTNSIYINSVAITSGGGVSYSGYTTTCGAPAQKYAINITAAQNGSFATTPANEAAEGKTVTIKATPATHYHLASVTVKDASDATVAVSGEGNTRTFVMPAKAVTISGTFEQDAKVTVRFINNGEEISSADYFPGEEAVAPADPTPACDKYNFEGWAKEAVTTETETKPTLFTSFLVSTAQDYYAIYSRSEAGQGGEAAFDGTTGGTFKIYAQVGETKYYATATVGGNNKVASTTTEAEAAEFTLAKVDGGFTIMVNEKYLAYAGSGTNVNLRDDAYTWSIVAATADAGSWRVNATTGSNRALAFRAGEYNVFGGYSTGNINGTEYFDLEIGGGAPAAKTYYSSTLNCTETAIDNNVVAPKAIKVLENGQIVIILGDQKYTIFGQKIQ